MCGIAGIYQISNSKTDSDQKPYVEGMMDCLSHRGPDASGLVSGKGYIFGHRRLKVIDLERGDQPMRSDDRKIALSYNGEVYNYRSIRLQLERAGVGFNTQSDTESILRLYEKKGVNALGEYEGMFALAIADERDKSLILAVDPFGKKPLYYTEVNGMIVFASEIKAILKHPYVPKVLDESSLAQYLAFEYVPAPKTIFKGIYKLEKGTFAKIDKKGIQIGSYVKEEITNSLPKTESAWVAQVREELKNAVQKRLVSDVPLGVYLSGGLDSSAVLSMVRACQPAKKIKTFTIGFDEPSFDESQYALKVSKHFDTEHIEETCSVDKMLNQHEDILSHLDEPMADASFLPTYMLSQLVRKHVTVALSGDGGDEVFCGYPTFNAHIWARRLDFLPQQVKEMFYKLSKSLPVSHKNFSFDFVVKRFLKGLCEDEKIRNQIWLGAFSDNEVDRIVNSEYRSDFQEIFRDVMGLKVWEEKHPIDALIYFYQKFYLQGDLLVKADRASMAHSLEVRSPMLDDQLNRLVSQMPHHYKVRRGQTKYILKKVMEGRLPDDIIHRKKKGFGVPVSKWIREDLKSHFEKYLSYGNIKKDGIFNPSMVQKLLNEHLSGKVDNRKPLWTLYVFQIWKHNYLD